MANLYTIVDKNKRAITFKPNRAQLDFESKRTERNITLKSRQLGMTTYECIDMLDDVLFTPNFSGLLIAHTKDDAIEIFDKKVMLAWQSILANHTDLSRLWKVDTESANKLKFGFSESEFSSIIVSNSGRSATNNRVHCSEFAKLCAKYPSKASEVISGTFPSVPIDGRIDIESTAEGMNGEFYEMFMEAWNRKRPPQPSEYTAHFYNWTWDDEEINKVDFPISYDKMDEGEKFKKIAELYEYNEWQITYYYSKWLSLNKDWDKLHQEYPNTVEEAFIASGNTFFNKERVVEQLALSPRPIECKSLVPDNLLNYYLNGELKIYELPQSFIGYVIGADVAEGKGGDSSCANGINNQTLNPAFSFNSNSIRPDDYAEFLNNIGLWYNRAYLAVESNSGLWVLTELYEKYKYPNLYWREKIDDITHAVSKQLGYHTGVGAQGRKVMLDNLQVEFNTKYGIWTDGFLKECLTFIKNDLGRPEAAEGKHDDEVISVGICHYVRENAPSELTRPLTAPRTVEERIMERLESRKREKSEIKQSDYI